MTARRLFLAAGLVLALPAAAQAACEKAKDRPLRTDEDLTLDYLMCRHREQAEALQRHRAKKVLPQDETQQPEGAISDLGRRTDPFAEQSRRTQESLDAMRGVNIEMGDRLKLIQPRRLP
ncbi:hypothetical protein LAZ40_01720 [Cereibacter sphaeroides]|uniref:hypothetical protein n=1 Tax=Rhodobacterales TaxID=204455 RepID=UPI000BBF3853|nr:MULTISPECIES: hypothetical protein [Paracoccaceae]MCE6949849.1 hypothetical protein [Cereibacter sphaeroides]MCE6957778.1 hypothetical protein [Cereibacter sphaeroides]MCE6967309.1 hypothetical protein [Cereibacter sphaeroides]MCE6971539.1 hypothetical protein [Cereibacter sphaeroides]